MKKAFAYALLALWAAVYTYLAVYAGKVFGVLVYSELKLMPKNTEPNIVNNIINNGSNIDNSSRFIFIVVYGPDLSRKLSLVNGTLAEEGFSEISPLGIQYMAQKIYWLKINTTLNNYTNEFFNYLNNIYNLTENKCIELRELKDAYEAARGNATALLYATYGAALFNYSTPQTAKFLQYYRNLSKTYGVDAAVRLAADEAYGNVSWLLRGITWRDWAAESSIDLVAERILSTKLNSTLVELARNVTELGVEKYLYLQLSSQSPPALRPYIPYVLCVNEAEAAAAAFKQSLLENLTSRYPPPTMYTIPQAERLLYGDLYALVIAEGTGVPRLNYSWAVPVSTDILMSQFTDTVTSEIPDIDKTTAVVMLAVLLLVFGTLVAPLAVLAEVGLSYLALLGLIYLISPYMPPYYLSIYIAAPVVFALGIDYNLLMLGRYAEERNKGAEPAKAAGIAVGFGKRAVLTSAAVAGLALGSFGFSVLPFMQTIGLALALSVLLVLATAFTATPALMALAGDRLFWPRRIEDIRLHEGRSRLLGGLVDLALNYSKIILIIFSIITIILIIFIVNNIRITTNPISAMPETRSKEALHIAQTYFRNITSLSTTYLVFTDKPNSTVINYLTSIPYYTNYTIFKRDNYYIISLKLSLTSTSDELLYIYNNLTELRKYGLLYIGGDAGWKHVYYTYIYLYFWHFQLYIILSAVILALMAALRSLLTPLRLVATVLMSMVWGLALNIAVFQIAGGQLTYWLQPVVLTTLLVAIGTDYDVFIVTRIREDVERGLDDRSAIRTAIVTTGPIVTGAALILALAFLSIAQSQLTVLQQIGATVAFSAIFDAYVVRPLLVPAIMNLLAKYNWWPLKLHERPR
ncbi:MAG: MMPL family transporter [Thermoproteus sp.]